MNAPRVIETMPPDLAGRLAGAGDGAPTGPAIFDAELAPHRSLPPQGLAIVLGVMVTVYTFVGAYFLSLGAWPVLGFCGLELFLVWLAFKVSYRQGRLRERVWVDDDAMLVTRTLPSGHQTRWRLQPVWTRVAIDHPVGHDSQVRVTSKGRTLILGAFLSPDERSAFADALGEALRKVRG